MGPAHYDQQPDVDINCTCDEGTEVEGANVDCVHQESDDGGNDECVLWHDADDEDDECMLLLGASVRDEYVLLHGADIADVAGVANIADIAVIVGAKPASLQSADVDDTVDKNLTCYNLLIMKSS